MSPAATAASTTPATPVWTDFRSPHRRGNGTFHSGLFEYGFLSSFGHVLLSLVRLIVRKF
jgi:hypothetical protein